jgi:hypothetical protein
MTLHKTIYVLLATTTVMLSCKDKYRPDIEYPDTGYLVVEGFINSGQGNTNIKLSRTVKVSDNASIKFENGATVRVEGDNNTNHALTPQGNGLYSVGQLPLNDASKYRLYIRTSTGQEYRSEFSNIIRTPNIDSVSWTRETSGVKIHINTHDPNNKTWYYTWSYEETWEYRSVHIPYLKHVSIPPGVLTIDWIKADHSWDTSMYRCWGSNVSSNILIGSSKKLSQDVIHLPLIDIEEGSLKLTELYSVIMYQHGVSERGYDFLQRMKKNTEQVGSLFDAQPSELNSNIRNIANTKEQVIGFIDVADGWEKRIFIYRRDLQRWIYGLDCAERIIDNIPDSVAAYADHSPVRPEEISPMGRVVRFMGAYPVCIDCRLRGGKTVKPPYWPQ